MEVGGHFGGDTGEGMSVSGKEVCVRNRGVVVEEVFLCDGACVNGRRGVVVCCWMGPVVIFHCVLWFRTGRIHLGFW